MTVLDVTHFGLSVATLGLLVFRGWLERNAARSVTSQLAEVPKALAEHRALAVALRESAERSAAAESSGKQLRGAELGRIAWRSALQLVPNGSKPERLAAALDAFRIADDNDNGKRDYTEAQARVFVESAAAEVT